VASLLSEIGVFDPKSFYSVFLSFLFMYQDLLLYGLVFLGLSVGSFTDLKTREVPDWLSFSLIFSGLGLRLLFSLTDFSWMIFFSGVIGFLACVVVGYLMFYSGQWGGGDAKLLMGVGALVGLDFVFPPKLLFFLVALLVVGAVYGLFWVFALAIKNWSKFATEFVRLHRRFSKLSLILFTLSAFLLVLFLVLSLESVFWLPFVVFALFPVGGFYLWLFFKSVEVVSFFKRVSPTQLTEGDWVVNDIVINGEKICGPKDLGLEKDQIARLVKFWQSGKIKTVLIKEGIPFVPSFLFAFLILFGFGLF